MPNERLLELQLIVEVEGVNARVKDFATWLAFAASTTDVFEVTVPIVAVNAAEVVLGATVTLAGTFTAELLLVRPTVTPTPGAALLSETVQSSVPAPTIDDWAHVNALRAPLGFN